MNGSTTEFIVGAMTHPGRDRAVNEDSLGLPESIPQATLARKGYLYLVADGVGGHQAGSVASQMAVDLIRRTYYEDPDPDIAASLQRAITAANAEIHRRAREQAYAQMGATVVAAVVRDGELVVANVGDSRAYLLRSGRLQQLTTDHTWVAERVAAGLLTPEEAAHHEMRHIITRSLGSQPMVEVDLYRHQLFPGDRLLLCTDGLWEAVSGVEMARFLKQEPQAAANGLVNRAIAAGSADDVTALVVGFGPLRLGILDWVEQAVAGGLASPWQRAALGIGALVFLVLLCGLMWRSVGGRQESGMARMVPYSAVYLTVTLTTTRTPIPTPTPGNLPVRSPTPSPLPTHTPIPIPTPSPTASGYCITLFIQGIPQPAWAVAQPDSKKYEPIRTFYEYDLPLPLDNAYPEEIIYGCADNDCHRLPFVKVEYKGQIMWILRWRLGRWEGGKCLELDYRK